MNNRTPLNELAVHFVEGVFKIELWGGAKDNMAQPHPLVMEGWTSLFIQCGRQTKILTLKSEIRGHDLFDQWRDIMLAKLVLGEELNLTSIEAELDGRRF